MEELKYNRKKLQIEIWQRVERPEFAQSNPSLLINYLITSTVPLNRKVVPSSQTVSMA